MKDLMKRHSVRKGKMMKMLMMNSARIWAKAKKTVVFITHQINEAIYLADRVVVMEGIGRGQCVIVILSDKHQQQLIMGCATESVLAPVWRDDRSLYVISDRSGWWNLYVADRLAAVERRDPQFGAVPGHLGVIPADPGQPGAIR